MANYALTQTGDEVQALLNQVTPNMEDIEQLQQDISVLLNTEQVQTLIDAALADYSTTAEVTQDITSAIAAALASYSTTSQMNTAISNAIASALTSYSTTAEVTQAINSAIADALTSYYTKTEVDNALSLKQNTISDLTTIRTNATAGKQASDDLPGVKDRVLFVEQSFGKYDGVREITLSQATAGKYVNVNGGETSASGYGISSQLSLNAGDILLIPSAQAVPAAVSVVARLVQRTYQKVIVYTYTYQQANPELYDTATADYNASLVYTAVYDTSGESPVLTGWIRDGQTYTTLPATHEVTEQFYEPLVKQAVSAMPSTGYYIYLCPTAMTVVISGLTATVNGGKALVVGWGIFKNITTNFVGAPGQSVLAQAFAVLFAAIDGLKAQLDNLGETKAVCIDSENLPKVCGEPLVIEGAGAPAVVPMFSGQRYHDTTGKKCYEAFAVTNSVNDWVLLN